VGEDMMNERSDCEKKRYYIRSALFF